MLEAVLKQLCANRGSAALRSVRFAPRYRNHNLGWCEAPQAVEHPRDTEKPPGTPSGRRLRLEIAPSPVERLFPHSGGVSRGSVRVGGETFLLPSYGFSFGYKRKGVSIAPLTEAQRNIVGHKSRVNAITGRGYNPSGSFAPSSPCIVGFRAPPVADTARKASRCRPQVRERIAEARAANGEGAEKCAPFPLVRHRGAEIRASSHSVSTGEPRLSQRFCRVHPGGQKNYQNSFPTFADKIKRKKI